MSESTMNLRAALGRREPIVASFVMIPRLEIIEMLALAGCNAAIIDMEHGPTDVSDLPGLAAFAKAAGIFSIARIAESRPSLIGAVLDAGFDGVMVPHVSSAAAALSVVSAARYPTRGTRSLNPYVRGASYSASGPEDLQALDGRSAVIGMLEGTGAISDLPNILETSGLDAIFVGPVDLSGEMGHPGQPDHPEVVGKVEEIFAACNDAGVACGVYAPTAKRANQWFDLGATIVAFSADSAMILDAFRDSYRDLDPKGRTTRLG